MSENNAFKDRFSQLTEEAQQKVLKRKQRLIDEHWDEERAELLSVGLLPAEKRRWPPRLRYRLADAVGRSGLLAGTDKWAKRYEVEEEKVREWLDDWFWRNHEKNNSDSGG